MNTEARSQRETAQLYDDIVQHLVTAQWARQLGRDEIADENLADALEVARQLSSGAAEALLDLRDKS